MTVLTLLLVLAEAATSHALHHMQLKLPVLQVEDLQITAPLVITNSCPQTIYPAIGTQNGLGPSQSGFKLLPGQSFNQTVSSNWQGRVWGRTNCTFPEGGIPPHTIGGYPVTGQACGTGDCNGILDCQVTGKTPTTVAEFTLDGGDGQTYYDISLVDGYNLPVAIVLQPNGALSLEDIPPNLTNPSCQGTSSLLAQPGYNPYAVTSDFLGTNSTYPLPFDNSLSTDWVQRWCPWDLQLWPPWKPGNGVYPYPDDNIQRPAFQPCYSACSKWGSDEDCCTGEYNSPDTCGPSLYSQQAKTVCPDAYSYAYDDQTSTFIIPVGGGFQIEFCPGGRSTNILATKAAVLQRYASNGEAGPSLTQINLNLTSSADATTRLGAERLAWGFAFIAAAGLWSVI